MRSGHFVSAAALNVTFVPAMELTTSGLSVEPKTDWPMTGFWIQDGKSVARISAETFPMGVSEILPT